MNKEGGTAGDVQVVFLRNGVLLGIPSTMHSVPTAGNGDHGNMDTKILADNTIGFNNIGGKLQAVYRVTNW